MDVYKRGDRIEIVYKYQKTCILLNFKAVAVYTAREEISGSEEALCTKWSVGPDNFKAVNMILKYTRKAFFEHIIDR
jgi:hypothetical protein